APGSRHDSGCDVRLVAEPPACTPALRRAYAAGRGGATSAALADLDPSAAAGRPTNRKAGNLVACLRAWFGSPRAPGAWGRRARNVEPVSAAASVGYLRRG